MRFLLIFALLISPAVAQDLGRGPFGIEPSQIIRHGDGPKKDLAIIENGIVTNKISIPAEWSEKEWAGHVPDGATVAESATAHIGDAYEDGKFRREVIWNDEKGDPVPLRIDVDAPPPEVIPELKPRQPSLTEQIEALKSEVETLKTQRATR